MTDTKTNLTSDLEVVVTANPTAGAKRIQTTKRHLTAVDEDLNTLREKADWTAKDLKDLGELKEIQKTLRSQLARQTLQEIKSINGCIHLELASLARATDKNGIHATTCIAMIEHFANQITELTQ